jgi:hypothetical protein
VFFFLAALKASGVGGLVGWFLPAGLSALSVGCAMWAFPHQPATVP